MEEELRRVASLVLQAPLTRRTRRELLYCGLGGLAGLLGFWIVVVLLAFGLTISASVLGTVVGRLLITLTLRLTRRLGSLHRRLSNRLLGHQVEAPGRRDGRAAVVGDSDPGHPVPRALHLDREHAAAPRSGVRDRVGAELGHARHQRLPGRAPGQQLTDEPARFRYGRGRAPVGTGPRTRRPDWTQAQYRVGTCHRRSPPDD